MKKKNKKTFIIFLVGFIVGIIGFTISFVMYKKEDKHVLIDEPEVMVGDLVFSAIDESLYIDGAIPTLDKFGVANKPFSFTIKNNYKLAKNYQVILSDNNSTIKNDSIRYELTKNNQVMGIHTLSNDSVIDIGTINPNEEISYAIKLWIDYNSEVKVGKLSKKITIIEIDSEESNINEPVLTEGMIPVYYNNNTNSWYKADIKNSYSNSWYNYENGIWANAITVNSSKREYYTNSEIGTKIMMEDVNAMFVWIPRFNYEIKNNEIDITFVKKSEKAYQAFDFDNNSLSGFWISKFESGMDENSSCIVSSLTKECNNTNNKLYFAPNYLLANRMTMANMFYSIRKMELKDNIYGFSANGTKINNDGTIKDDDNNIDIHMIKNSEWQAVAILSESKYGKNGNNDYSKEEKVIFNNNSNYTGKSFYKNKTYDYNTIYNGTGASTTGNITGVYDMNGGKREFVMINTSSLNIFSQKSNSGFITNLKESYYDTDYFDSNLDAIINERYKNENKINEEVITRGGYKNTGNIFSMNSVSDFIDKISLESNSRACLIINEEN